MEIYASWDCSGKIPHSVSPFPPHPFLSSVSDGRRAAPSPCSGRKSGGGLNMFPSCFALAQSSTARISHMNCVSPQSPKYILERLWAQMPEKTFIYFSFFSFFFSGWQHFINTGMYSSPLACVLPSKVRKIGLYTPVSKVKVISYWEFSCINQNVIYLT